MKASWCFRAEGDVIRALGNASPWASYRLRDFSIANQLLLTLIIKNNCITIEHFILIIELRSWPQKFKQ